MATSLISKAYNLFTSPKTAIGAFACGVVAHLADHKTVSKVAFLATAISALGHAYNQWTTKSGNPTTSQSKGVPVVPQNLSKLGSLSAVAQPAVPAQPSAVALVPTPTITLLTAAAEQPAAPAQPVAEAAAPASAPQQSTAPTPIDFKATVLQADKLFLVCSGSSSNHVYVEPREERFVISSGPYAPVFRPQSLLQNNTIWVTCPKSDETTLATQKTAYWMLKSAYLAVLEQAYGNECYQIAFKRPLASRAFETSSANDLENWDPCTSVKALYDSWKSLRGDAKSGLAQIRVEFPNV
ncbi:MAG: hypothetical protein HY069_02685, partial [Chlamydiia bacterium]|nr:hypothetical protein [Chlamydiia bacterium]